MRLPRIGPICAALFLLADISVARAQSETATLSVAVSDGSGAAVPGAMIVLLQSATNSRRELVTERDGRAV